MLSGAGYRMGEGGGSVDREVRRRENPVSLCQVRSFQAQDQADGKLSPTRGPHVARFQATVQCKFTTQGRANLFARPNSFLGCRCPNDSL
jgi:hypothetical protein